MGETTDLLRAKRLAVTPPEARAKTYSWWIHSSVVVRWKDHTPITGKGWGGRIREARGRGDVQSHHGNRCQVRRDETEKSEVAETGILHLPSSDVCECLCLSPENFTLHFSSLSEPRAGFSSFVVLLFGSFVALFVSCGFVLVFFWGEKFTQSPPSHKTALKRVSENARVTSTTRAFGLMKEPGTF